MGSLLKSGQSGDCETDLDGSYQVNAPDLALFLVG